MHSLLSLFLFVLGFICAFVLGDRRHDTVDLIFFCHLFVLEAMRSVNRDLTESITGEDDGVVFADLDNSSWRRYVHIFAFFVLHLVEVCEQGLESVNLQVPNFNTAIVCDRSEDRRGLW